MKRRSGLKVMAKLIGLVKPLTGYMLLAIFMGLLGHLCACWITILGGYAVANLLGISVPVTLTAVFVLVVVFALCRAGLRYGEQSCNHFIAFKLLALIRDKVFQALRRLSPAKLEGRGKGDLISVLTSDIELLEVFYAHTISPAAIALLFTVILCLFIGSFHWALGAAGSAGLFGGGTVDSLGHFSIVRNGWYGISYQVRPAFQFCAGQPAGVVGNHSVRRGKPALGGDGGANPAAFSG